jgi:hypothetical protein
MQTPTPTEIRKAIDNGATFEDIDEMFYPGEVARTRARQAKYPIPEGTGRRNSSTSDIRYVPEFERDQFHIGTRKRTLLYINDSYIGYIDEIRRGMLDIYWKTHDGEEFAHWGGPTGAEWHLKNKYWLYGNPPENKYPSRHPTYGEFCKKVEAGEIIIETGHYESKIKFTYKTKFHWIKLTDELLKSKVLDRAYDDYVRGNREHVKNKKKEIEVTKNVKSIWMKIRGIL